MKVLPMRKIVECAFIALKHVWRTMVPFLLYVGRLMCFLGLEEEVDAGLLGHYCVFFFCFAEFGHYCVGSSDWVGNHS